MSWMSWQRLSMSKQTGGLRFRNLQKFNQALLASQVWKICQRPQSMVYRVLKHRYFRNTTLWEAARGRQSSYGWQSLIHGRELLLQGMQFNIGNGTNVTLSDKWLPTVPPRAPKLLPYTNPTLKVKVLIDSSLRQWDLDTMRDLVEQEDIPLIQKHYLPLLDTEDDVIWPYTNDGNYSVKSGYHFTNQNHQPAMISPPLAAAPDITKNIWSSSIPPKLKHFLWKIGSGILATKGNLRARHIPIDVICAKCCSGDETTEHAFFSCSYVQQTWRLSYGPRDFTDPAISLHDKLRLLLSILVNVDIPLDQRLLPVWLIWRVWKSRNELLFNNKVYTPEEVFLKAKEDVQEWISLTKPTSEEQSRGTIQTEVGTRWRPPSYGMVKCNFDASHRLGNATSAMGWIIRNHQGTVLHAGMGKYEGRMTVLEAELSSLIWAMQSCYALGYRNVTFERDNLMMIKYINTRFQSPRLKHLLSSVYAWQSSFTSISFTHVKRLGNMCADVLAKKASQGISDWRMFHSVPNFLYEHVYKDNYQ